MSFAKSLIEQVEKTLQDWALGVTGRPVIFEPTDGPRPIGPYVSMKLSPMQRVGRDVRMSRDQAPEDGEDVWDVVQGQRTASVSVNLFRDADPHDAAHEGMGLVENDALDLLMSLSHARWIDHFCAGRLGFVSNTELRDFGEVIKEGWEQRRQFDLVLNLALESEAEIERIDSVEIHHGIKGETIIVDAAGGMP